MAPTKQVDKGHVSLERLVVEYVPANSVTPNSYNPNRQSDHDFMLLCLSMMEDGFTQPIVGQRSTREIVDGEHRWTGGIVTHKLRLLGYTVDGKGGPKITEKVCAELRANRGGVLLEHPEIEVPIVFTDMTPEQMRIATLRHNRARGSEDIDLSAAVLRDLQALGALDWAQDSLMLDDLEIQRLLDDIPAPDALAAPSHSRAWEPDTIGEETIEAAVKTGSTAGVPIETPGGATYVTALSEKAIVEVRAREDRLAAATSEEERKEIKKTSRIYRLNLMFSGDEADLVERVLGNNQAQALIDLCRKELGLETE